MNMSFADAVRRNALTSKATDTEIELKIKTWLRGAVDRQGGRARRMGNKTLGARTTDARRQRAVHAVSCTGRVSSPPPADVDCTDSSDSLPGGPHHCSDDEMADLR